MGNVYIKELYILETLTNDFIVFHSTRDKKHLLTHPPSSKQSVGKIPFSSKSSTTVSEEESDIAGAGFTPSLPPVWKGKQR